MYKKALLVFVSMLLIPSIIHAKVQPDMRLTQVKVFTPWMSASEAINPSIRVTKKAQGSCASASLVNPRPDAWRCKVESETHDPCFVSSSGRLLACIKSPWDRNAVVMTLTSALPTSQGNSENYLEQNPWGIELDNNIRCVGKQDGQSPRLGGMASNSICFDQSSNITSVKYLDSFNQEMPTWLVFIKQDDLFLEQVPIKTAWY
jgi:hypothetical protein